MAKTKEFLLPSEVDITHIKEIYTDLQKFVGNKKNIIIDASKVSKITSPGAQILLSLTKHIDSKEGELKINNMSEAFSNMLKELGFNKQLDQWGN